MTKGHNFIMNLASSCINHSSKESNGPRSFQTKRQHRNWIQLTIAIKNEGQTVIIEPLPLELMCLLVVVVGSPKNMKLLVIVWFV